MAKKDSHKVKGINPMDTLVKKMLATMDPDQITDYNMTKREDEFKNIINDELELTKGISQGSIIDFSRSLNNYNKNPDATLSDSTDDILKYINQ